MLTMIDGKFQRYNDDGVSVSTVIYVGLSTDNKPTGPDIGNGSAIWEMDTRHMSFYDEASQTWN